MPRFAIPVVVEARDADEAAQFVGDMLARGIHWDYPRPVHFIGDPSPVADRDEYDTRSVATAIVTDPNVGGLG